MKLKNKVAVVTGAAGKCIGRSTALTLAREGAKVVVNYRSGSKAHEIVDYINSHGGTAIAIKADVFKKEDCDKLIDGTIKAFGKIDVLIIGPGAGWHAEKITELASENALDDMMSETAPLYYLLPRTVTDMKKRNWGRIIGISINTVRPSPSLSYNASKAARTAILKQLSTDTWKSKITVNIICPSPVEELPSLDDAIEHLNHGAAWETRTRISPQDIAEGVAFLCSDEGSFINGCEFNYDF